LFWFDSGRKASCNNFSIVLTNNNIEKYRLMILECVPNFSEGRDKDTIEAIAQSISSVEGVQLLNVDPNHAANRTVYTFIGQPEAVCEAAYQAVKVASFLIDMSIQTGEHLRMGACDVCPLIPVSGISTDEANEYALALSERMGKELGLAVYNYEYSAKHDYRRRLEQIRKGQYEALPEKMKQPEWKPDFGRDVFNPKFGAMVLGVRKFLIAYNINLSTKDVFVAKRIAADLRESGRLIEKDGMKKRIAGRFKALKGIGWYIEDFGCVQVSYNITDYEQTSITSVFEATQELAHKYNTEVLGSELIGLLPLLAAVRSADEYIQKEGLAQTFTDFEKVELLARRIGLSSVKEFDPSKQIIEFVSSGFIDK